MKEALAQLDGGAKMIEPDRSLAIIDTPCDVIETQQPFGERWGDEIVTLTGEHLAALHQGKVVAVDVMNEYVVFLRLQTKSENE